MSDAATLTWTDRVEPTTAARVRELLARAKATDGVAPVSEQAVLSLAEVDPATGHLLAERAGELVGYANLVAAHDEHPAMAEVAVDPSARGVGIGTDLVRAALAEGGPGARVWAHGDLPAAKALASGLGLGTARELWQMRRSLATPELPELDFPDGLTIRTYAGPTDHAELLRVNNAAFSWHPEQGGWTERDIEARVAESWFDGNGLFQAFDTADPDRLLGFHWTKQHPDAAPAGEV